MDGLRRIAIAHYEAAPPQVKALADNFFRELDGDGNGWVSLREFVAFMRQYGDERLSDPEFFMELDRDRNGVLDFWEVMTLYYIVKSRRPFCDWCDKFIKNTYYSCVACFHSSRGPFNLCVDCYRSCECDHNHNGRVQFLDNYTLLEVKRHNSARAPPSGMRNNTQPGTSHAMVRSQSNPAARRVVRRQTGNSNQYNAMVLPASRMSGWSRALQAMEMGISIGNIATTLCSIL
ncbi:hypothetical protein Pfo_026488 [Paulownia fortunei]|nr:hypothetical protein Pfo_026488 [Paulownia fortunei]